MLRRLLFCGLLPPWDSRDVMCKPGPIALNRTRSRQLTVALVLATLLTPCGQAFAGNSVWDEYKRVRTGEATLDDTEEPAPAPRPVPAPGPAQPTAQPAAEPALQTTPPPRPPGQSNRRATAAPVSAPGTPTEQGGWWAFYLGSLDIDRDPFYGPYKTDFQWAYSRKEPLPPNPRVVVSMHGSGGGIGAMGVFGPSDLGDIEVRTQDAETYSQDWREWWTYGSDGEPYPGRRIAATLEFLKQRYRIDFSGRGMVLQGPSMGGAGAVVQTMILPDPWRKQIAWSSARAGVIMPRQIAKKHPGQYPNMPRDGGSGRALWDSIDFAVQSARDRIVQGIHFRHAFSSNDQFSDGPRGNTQLEFVNLVEKHRIGGAFAWVRGSHGTSEQGVRMPDLSRFEVPEQDVTLDRAHPAITNSTGNHPLTAKDRVDEQAFPRGHYNLGIIWHHARIVDKRDRLVFPLRYIARKNFGKGVPDQPHRITVSVTPRRSRNFTLEEGETLRWSWDGGALEGTAIVRDGLVTVDGIPLVAGEPYKNLQIYR